LWQKLNKIWRNRKPVQVPLPAMLRPAAQLVGAGGVTSNGDHDHEEELVNDRTLVAVESNGSTAEANAAASPRRTEPVASPDAEPRSLQAQMRMLREEVTSLSATLSSEQADRHQELTQALKDLAEHASTHNQSLVQMHEDLQLMTQTQREGVSRITDLSQAADRQAQAQQTLAETMRKLEAKTAADYEALSAALARTRQTILAVTLIAAGGLAVLIPMAVAMLV
jgi:chromosome segregation ATPase